MRHVRTFGNVFARWSALALTLTLACGGSDDERAEVTPCERMRDHLVELRLTSVTDDRDEHREVLRRALGAEFIESCERSMSDDQVSCIVNADEAAEAAACVPEAK